ncbi:MAG: PqqD family protein [Candidatus Eisenbacteria bacterium]|nr:PqqD family protein [Candidatus Eisenbacteria bacterium]MBU1948405.1 PqqD family protein [Candidatus Eisenbacteria bacterium]
MEPRDIYRVNSPTAIGEILEGELVMINLDTGTYYSTGAVGAALWELINEGSSIGEICREFSSRFDAEKKDIEREVLSFLSKLQAEKLIVPADDSNHAKPKMVGISDGAPESAGRKEPFEVPVLSKYKDMQDMLLLDPIHDVEETGWPMAKKPDPETENNNNGTWQ